jgi:hypothetical protein
MFFAYKYRGDEEKKKRRRERAVEALKTEGKKRA